MYGHATDERHNLIDTPNEWRTHDTGHYALRQSLRFWTASIAQIHRWQNAHETLMHGKVNAYYRSIHAIFST